MSRLRTRIAALGAAALTATALTACSDDAEDKAAPATAEDGAGNSAAVLEYGAADTLASLGLEDSIKAISTLDGKLPEPLEELQSKVDDGEIKDIGSFFEPKFDVIAELKPDHIFYGARSEKVSGELDKLSDDVINTQAEAEGDTGFFESNRENVEAVAKAHGKEAEAEEKLAEIDEEVAATKEAAKDAGTGLIIMTTGGKISAYGPESGWYGFIYNELGLTPAGDIPMEDHHGATLSWEEIAEMDPDHIFVFDRDAAIGKEGKSAEEILDNEIFKQTKAAKNDDVHYLEPGNWYLVGGGLDAMKDMVEDVHEGLE